MQVVWDDMGSKQAQLFGCQTARHGDYRLQVWGTPGQRGRWTSMLTMGGKSIDQAMRTHHRSEQGAKNFLTDLVAQGVQPEEKKKS